MRWVRDRRYARSTLSSSVVSPVIFSSTCCPTSTTGRARRGKRENTNEIGIMRMDITASCRPRVLRLQLRKAVDQRFGAASFICVALRNSMAWVMTSSPTRLINWSARSTLTRIDALRRLQQRAASACCRGQELQLPGFAGRGCNRYNRSVRRNGAGAARLSVTAGADSAAGTGSGFKTRNHRPLHHLQPPPGRCRSVGQGSRIRSHRLLPPGNRSRLHLWLKEAIASSADSVAGASNRPGAARVPDRTGCRLHTPRILFGNEINDVDEIILRPLRRRGQPPHPGSSVGAARMSISPKAPEFAAGLAGPDGQPQPPASGRIQSHSKVCRPTAARQHPDRTPGPEPGSRRIWCREHRW